MKKLFDVKVGNNVYLGRVCYSDAAPRSSGCGCAESAHTSSAIKWNLAPRFRSPFGKTRVDAAPALGRAFRCTWPESHSTTR